MWVGVVVFSIISFRLGMLYSDFRDLMMARRVSKLIKQRKQIEEERIAYEELTSQ